MRVGDIRKIEPNVHAGTRHLRALLGRFLDDPGLQDVDRMLFALAAYNAGATRVAALRREAARAGYDPDVWFNQVERIAAKRIGRETVQYVRSVHASYLAYRLYIDQLAARAAARKELGEPVDFPGRLLI
jgi:membrane-bound lytic murein transglycosylase MltF